MFVKKKVVEESDVEEDEASDHDVEWDSEEEQWVPADKQGLGLGGFRVNVLFFSC